MSKLKPCPLGFDPFGGDFGDQADKILFDKMVHSRKEHQCFWCGGTIKLKEAHRSRAEVVDGALYSYRWCSDCCAAMISDIESGTFNATEKRIEIRRSEVSHEQG